MGTLVIKNRIRELREERKLTQQALAEACQVTRQTIIALEGQKYAPSLELAFRLARLFDLKVEEIFAWAE